MREITDKQDFIKITITKTSAKTNIKIIKTTDFKKRFAEDIYDKELLCKVHKEAINLNYNEANDPIKIWAKDLRHLTKEGIQMTNKHMKRGASLYVVKEMHIETINR